MKTSESIWNHLKTIIIILLSVIVSLQFYTLFDKWTAVDTTSPIQPITTGKTAAFKVGFSMGTLKEERWLRDRDVLLAKIKDLGGEAVVVNANNDDDDQLRQVKYLISQDIDVLIIVPNDMKKAVSAVNFAKSRGVKVISYDRLVLDADVDFYISFDNVKVGERMGGYIRSTLSEGNVLIINGAKSDNNTADIKKGYTSVLNTSGIQIIGEYWADQWLSEYAYDITDRLLTNGTKIDAILAGNDGLAGAAIRALTEHMQAGKVIVVGQDADLEACQRIVLGTQRMTIYKPINYLAETAAILSKNLADGDSFDAYETLDNGKYTVPYLVLEPIVVDANNMEQTILKDGFHLRDDVYK